MKLAKGLFLFFSAGMFILSAVSYLSRHTDTPREVETASAGASATEGYLVCSEGNRVCVRPLDGGAARFVEGVLVSDLPPADREQLSRGLVLPDQAALLALLEDYTG